MTKKNIRPQQAAPVQRETVGANYSAAAGKLTAQFDDDRALSDCLRKQLNRGCDGLLYCIEVHPFAGDDAE